jgi:phage shock protein PspC (stress-responsive transcriptional regulator)
MKKLYRTNSSTIGGVCGGLGAYFNIDGTLFKILFLILIFTPFPIILTYLLLWISIPNKVV